MSLPGSVTSGSGSHSPTYSSRRERADSSWLMQTRLTIVTKNALGDRMSASDARCQRMNASWRASSASATLPSMRYAMEKRRLRCCSKAASLLESLPLRGDVPEALSNLLLMQIFSRGDPQSAHLRIGVGAMRTVLQSIELVEI